MEFEYRLISEKRCNEIDSWNIKDPYGYGKKLSTHGNYWVTNEDESILFCHAFTPRHDDYEDKYEIYLFILFNEYHFIRYDFKSIEDEESNGVKCRYEKIVVLEENFINISDDKDKLIQLIKKLISKYEEKSCRSKIERKYRFDFYYRGDEI